jgi:hypothetical protein
MADWDELKRKVRGIESKLEVSLWLCHPARVRHAAHRRRIAPPPACPHRTSARPTRASPSRSTPRCSSTRVRQLLLAVAAPVCLCVCAATHRPPRPGPPENPLLESSEEQALAMEIDDLLASVSHAHIHTRTRLLCTCTCCRDHAHAQHGP